MTPSSGANPFLMSERPARKWPDLRCALAGEGVTLEGCSRRRVLLKNRLLVTTGAPGAPRGMRVGGRAAPRGSPFAVVGRAASPAELPVTRLCCYL